MQALRINVLYAFAWRIHWTFAMSCTFGYLVFIFYSIDPAIWIEEHTWPEFLDFQIKYVEAGRQIEKQNKVVIANRVSQFHNFAMSKRYSKLVLLKKSRLKLLMSAKGSGPSFIISPKHLCHSLKRESKRLESLPKWSEQF